MSWRALSIEDVALSPQEQAALNAIQASADKGADFLLKTIREFVGALKGAGYSVNEDDTAPDRLIPFIVDRARYRWLLNYPALEMLRKGREQSNKDALDALAKIDNRELNVEPPNADDAAPASNWNSERKLVMRTHGIPAPGAQTTGQGYANPNGPTDSTT